MASETTKEQRQSERESQEAPVRVLLEAQEVRGLSDNLSSAGILLFTDEPLRLRVEVRGDEGLRTFAGRLVRAQRMNETHTGLAIEFDPDPSS